jgi:hypothetical protein
VTIRPDGAVIVLATSAGLWAAPPADSVQRSDPQLQWIIAWGCEYRPDLAAFNLIVAVPRAVGKRDQPSRLVRQARVEYGWLEPAGSILAISIDRTPNAAVEWAGGAVVIRWGPSSGLNQLLADRPDSLRVTMKRVPQGPAERFWLRPTYPP